MYARINDLKDFKTNKSLVKIQAEDDIHPWTVYVFRNERVTDIKPADGASDSSKRQQQAIRDQEAGNRILDEQLLRHAIPVNLTWDAKSKDLRLANCTRVKVEKIESSPIKLSRSPAAKDGAADGLEPKQQQSAKRPAVDK